MSTEGRHQTALRSILVVVDPSAYEQPALAKAVRIATQCGSSVELFACDVDEQIPECWAGESRAAEYLEMKRLRLLGELRSLAEPLKAQGLTVTTACEWHAPLEQGIGHHAIRSRPDLVIKETQRHTPLPRSALTRTDWNLIRQIPAALMLVRPAPWTSKPRILAAVDPCHPADRPMALDQAIVDTARGLADAIGGALNVGHVLHRPPHLPGQPTTHEQTAVAHAHARNRVKELAWRVAANTRFAEGSPADGLLRLTREWTPDVLVMGAVARLGGAQAVPGGTAAQILQDLACDLLVVKPPEFVGPLLATDGPGQT
jgi:universal stress protein E